ncbi:hypothetical protein FACS189440_18400 [Bacteroidia bacterium]|nr:hypothetical protein FACS189440_18400 [Bacteroidia bacterium]
MSQVNRLLTMPLIGEIQRMLTMNNFGEKKLKAKINSKYVLTDEQLSNQLSGSDEEYQVSPYTEDDYKELIDSHRPRFSNGLEQWL